MAINFDGIPRDTAGLNEFFQDFLFDASKLDEPGYFASVASRGDSVILYDDDRDGQPDRFISSWLNHGFELTQTGTITNGVDGFLTFTATNAESFVAAGRLAYDSAGDVVGVYTLMPDSSGPDDYAGSLTDTALPIGSIGIGGSATGTIESAGDHDLFGVDLIAGTAYAITISGADSGSGSLSDPYLRLYDSSGLEVACDDDSGPGLDSQLLFTPTVSGIYALDAAHYNSTGTGTYQVSVSEAIVPVLPPVDPDSLPLDHPSPLIISDLPSNIVHGLPVIIGPIILPPADFFLLPDSGSPDDYAGSLTDTTLPIGSIGIGGSATGTIESTGDHDLFAVDLIAGTSYNIQASGADSGSGSLSDPYLRLYDSAGLEVAFNDDSGPGLDSQLFFTPTVSGTYALDVAHYSFCGTGTYQVSVSEGIEPIPPPTEWVYIAILPEPELVYTDFHIESITFGTDQEVDLIGIIS